jgi:hypothetical protein
MITDSAQKVATSGRLCTKPTIMPLRPDYIESAS